jgi:AraC-like DNA-binding protein
MTYLLFGGGMFMVLMGFIWLIHPERSALNNYFAAMYVSTGLIVLYSWAERALFIYSVYPLYNMQIPLCYFFAPLLYYGFSHITDLDRKPARFFWPHFIPAAVAFAVVLAINLANAPVFAALPADASPRLLRSHPAFLAAHLVGLGSNVYILYFLSRILVNGIRFFRSADLKEVKELFLLLFFIGLFYLDILLMMAAHLIGSLDLLHTAKFLSSATFILYAFYSFRYPEYTQKVIRKSKQLRYRHTQLRGLNTDALLERLADLMENEKLYRDMELTLVSLSAQLEVTPRQLSEILNERLRLNFSSYLNQYRIREAEARLLKRPEANILEIAFDVGYSSKASFYSNFQKVTGLPPNEYRRAKGGRTS